MVMTFATPSSATRVGSAWATPGGYPVPPVATHVPCPGMWPRAQATDPLPPGVANGMLWLKERFLPASFRAFRCAWSTLTGTVRKLVAVGMPRLAFMKRASVAAGPRRGVVSAPAGAGGGGAGAAPPSVAGGALG